MKKAILFMLASSVALCVNASPEEFKDADVNKDGALSTTEARMAMPELVIVDTNNDGMLNLAEVESAIPDLMFTGDAATKESALIGATEYRMIVQVLAQSKQRDS